MLRLKTFPLQKDQHLPFFPSNNMFFLQNLAISDGDAPLESYFVLDSEKLFFNSTNKRKSILGLENKTLGSEVTSSQISIAFARPSPGQKSLQTWDPGHETNSSRKSTLHPGRLTWNLKTTQLKREISFQTIIFKFHVNLPGCK